MGLSQKNTGTVKSLRKSILGRDNPELAPNQQRAEQIGGFMNASQKKDFLLSAAFWSVILF